MTDVDDILKTALEGNAMKTLALVNMTFVLHSTGPIQSNVIRGRTDPKTGEPQPDKTSYSYLASIQLDGEEEHKNAWLGGGFLTPQVTALIENDKLPARVRLIMDSSRDGNPYILVGAGEQPKHSSGNGTVTGKSAQAMAEEKLKTSSKDDLALIDILAECGIDAKYSPEGKLTTLDEEGKSFLTTQQAATLIGKLR